MSKTYADVPPSILSRQRDQRALDTPSMTELQSHIRLLEMWRSRARKLGAIETHVHVRTAFAVLEIVWE